MNFSLSTENISAWREGHVMNDIVFIISMKIKPALTALKKISMTSVLPRFMNSGQQKSLPRKNVICSLSATMYAAQKMPIHILPLLRWMN